MLLLHAVQQTLAVQSYWSKGNIFFKVRIILLIRLRHLTLIADRRRLAGWLLWRLLLLWC
jgi:hypothetical protein